MKKIYFGLVAFALLYAIAICGMVSAEKDCSPMVKGSIGIGGGWSVSQSGTTLTATAPNGVRKVIYHVASSCCGTSYAPYKLYVYGSPGYSSKWVTF